MRYLLDTNACIAAIRRREPLLSRLISHSPDEFAISWTTVAELWFGALKSSDPPRGRAVTDAFLAPFSILSFEGPAAEAYAEARLHLETRGTPIGERDLLIASTALAQGLTVVTNDTREFRRVPGLDVEDWSAPDP